MDFWCYYCNEENDFTGVIHHTLQAHAHQVLKTRKVVVDPTTGKRQLQSKNFKVVPIDVYKTGKYFTIDEKEQKIHIHDIDAGANVHYIESPVLKKVKPNINQGQSDISNPVHSERVSRRVLFWERPESVVYKQSPADNDNLTNLVELLPRVITSLKETGHMDVFLQIYKANK